MSEMNLRIRKVHEKSQKLKIHVFAYNQTFNLKKSTDHGTILICQSNIGNIKVRVYQRLYRATISVAALQILK